MNTFLALLFAHLLADYPLQGEFLSKMKGSNGLIMFTHCAIWTGCICVAAHLCGLTVPFWMVCCLWGGHVVIDEAKCAGVWVGSENPLGWPLLFDQVCHVLQILVLLAVTR